MLALAIALAGLGALVAVFVFHQVSSRAPVVVLTRNVPIGQQITRADVTTSEASVDSSVQVITGGQLPTVVGKRAAVDLRAGTMLAPSEVTTALTPAAGQEIVPVAMKPSQLPARGLQPGDQVLVIATPGSAAGQPGQTSTSGTTGTPLRQQVRATVDQVGSPDADGLQVVDLLVDANAGSDVAQQASTGQIAVLLTSRQP